MPKNTVEKLSDSRLRIKCECGNMHEVSMLKSGDLEIETIRIAPRQEPPKKVKDDSPKAPEKKPSRFRTLLSPPDEPEVEAGESGESGEDE